MQRIEPRYVKTDVEAIHVRDIHSYGGDTLVVRRVGNSGHKAKPLEAARSLGLKSINDMCIIEAAERRADDGEDGRRSSSIFGQAVTSQHLLTFRPLRRWIPEGYYDDLWVAEDGAVMYREEYSDPSGPGEILVVGDGEYLQAETHDQGLVVAWTSRLAPGHFLLSAMETLGPPQPGESAAFVQLDMLQGDGAEGAGSAGDVIDYLDKKQPPVTFVSLDLISGARVTWTAPAARLKGYETLFSEVSVTLAPDSTRESVFALIDFTATEELKAHRTQAVGAIRQLAA